MMCHFVYFYINIHNLYLAPRVYRLGMWEVLQGLLALGQDPAMMMVCFSHSLGLQNPLMLL
jgi:hypothetical protein